jgi:purine-binding chemotaxis protein CheW
MVLEDEGDREHFGLMVDAVGGVVSVNRRMHEANPSTLAARYRAFFDGAYKMGNGLMVQLDSHKLHPSRLAEAGVLGRRAREGADCG